MKHTIAKWTAAGLLATSAALAHAQPGTSADDLLNDADTVVHQIDAGQYDAVWNGTAAFIKNRFTEQQFIAETQQSRQALGTVKQRGWAAVTRIQYTNSKDLPNGLYANVDYATTLATGKMVFEKLSFRLESDGKWHLTGYVPRQEQEVQASSVSK